MADAPEQAPPAADYGRLMLLVRQGDQRAIRQAYQTVFAGELGRLVLLHHLADCGVGGTLGVENLKYAAGRHDAALELASLAGFDKVALATAVLTDTLEENPHETSAIDPAPALVVDDIDE